ncbi:hypothetical protein BDZ89DRAFT_438667 [Hymenopellis radicata]|nr:hypothetical protein BDZ89DRAFT_438667 [Hymenopellis radicata]
MRFTQHVINGDFKDARVFLGLVETMVLATERDLRGVGMRNFKYPPEFREWGELVRAISPQLHRNMSTHFKMETQRSIKNKISKRPRFALGIQDETFAYAEKYCTDYKYPRSFPLCLGVDDTKLYADLQPLYDGPKKTWFLMGTPGENQIVIPDMSTLDEVMKEKHDKATKLRLWVLQIPIAGIPPLVLAILPISSKIKAPALAKHQYKLFSGLVSHGFRIVSNASDGAAVERDCHRRLTAKGTTTYHIIRSPLPQYPAISIPLYCIENTTSCSYFIIPMVLATKNRIKIHGASQ